MSSFIFRKEYLSKFKELSEKEQLELLKAIIRAGITGKISKVSSQQVDDIMLGLYNQIITERNELIKRKNNAVFGKLGGRPKKSKTHLTDNELIINSSEPKTKPKNTQNRKAEKNTKTHLTDNELIINSSEPKTKPKNTKTKVVLDKETQPSENGSKNTKTHLTDNELIINSSEPKTKPKNTQNRKAEKNTKTHLTDNSLSVNSSEPKTKPKNTQNSQVPKNTKTHLTDKELIINSSEPKTKPKNENQENCIYRIISDLKNRKKTAIKSTVNLKLQKTVSPRVRARLYIYNILILNINTKILSYERGDEEKSYDRGPGKEKRREEEVKPKTSQEKTSAEKGGAKKTFKSWTKEDLEKAMEPFREKYSDNLIEDFIEYWSEPTASGKLRINKEPAFGIPQRIGTFMRNDRQNRYKKFDRPKQSQEYIFSTPQAAENYVIEVYYRGREELSPKLQYGIPIIDSNNQPRPIEDIRADVEKHIRGNV